MIFPRVIVLGDIHGCLDELKQLLVKAEYDPSKDRLIFVGDLVDRGPDSVGVVKWVRESGAECVLGNHDERLIRYWQHVEKWHSDPDYVIPMTKPTWNAYDQLTDEDFKWLASLPLFIRINEKWAVIHAGLEPGKSLEMQSTHAILHGRYLRMSTKKIERTLWNLDPKDACVWAKMWDGPENIIYGHQVTPTRHPHIDIGPAGAISVGIDTGCCFGHNLTAMVMDHDGSNFTFVSVQAKNAYDPDLKAYIAATSL